MTTHSNRASSKGRAGRRGFHGWAACALVIVMCAGCSGCQSAYFNALESLGFAKRDLVVSRAKAARNAQEDAKEQFETALEAFQATVHFDGGDLEAEYNRLNDQLERSESRAEAVRKRIDDVESVSKALFREWETEIDEYSNAEYKQASRRQLQDTVVRYERFISAMKRAEARIEPVLVPMRDQVLFLKHNLNAQAIAALQSELSDIEIDVSALIEEMEAAIAEADAFIAGMEDDAA